MRDRFCLGCAATDATLFNRLADQRTELLLIGSTHARPRVPGGGATFAVLAE
jgi:hypothetical protein